jgi:hypothetical protein
MSDWSVSTLKEYVEQRLLAQEKSMNTALISAEKAVAMAERNAEEWRKGANEWRGSMTDRERNFVSRLEFEALKERVDKTEGSGKGMRELWGWVVAAAGIVTAGLVSVVAFLKGKV